MSDPVTETTGGHTRGAAAVSAAAKDIRRGKKELMIAWWVMLGFYQLYAISFFMIAPVQPPPDPAKTVADVVQWYGDNQFRLLLGVSILYAIIGMTTLCNALIAYSMYRMSVSRVFAYSYIAFYALSAIPGLLLTCFALTTAAIRPDRDPEVLHWLYDLAFLAFDGTMGVFLLGSLIWMLAILLDKNRVLPRWFGYLNLCNALTEVVVAPCWIFQSGFFAWDGVVTWWINILVFGVYTTAFVTLLRRMIQAEDFGTGQMPYPPQAPHASVQPRPV